LKTLWAAKHQIGSKNHCKKCRECEPPCHRVGRGPMPHHPTYDLLQHGTPRCAPKPSTTRDAGNVRRGRMAADETRALLQMQGSGAAMPIAGWPGLGLDALCVCRKEAQNSAISLGRDAVMLAEPAAHAGTAYDQPYDAAINCQASHLIITKRPMVRQASAPMCVSACGAATGANSMLARRSPPCHRRGLR
jgi:hypothetical protein